jgi:hypothetical protein
MGASLTPTPLLCTHLQNSYASGWHTSLVYRTFQYICYRSLRLSSYSNKTVRSHNLINLCFCLVSQLSLPLRPSLKLGTFGKLAFQIKVSVLSSHLHQFTNSSYVRTLFVQAASRERCQYGKNLHSRVSRVTLKK